MSELRRSRVISIRLLILLGLLGSVHGHVFARDGTVEVPGNAHAKSYGNGWDCNIGYREIDGGCATVKVPVNAYPTNRPYGSGWACNRGYLEGDETCRFIKVPSNAYLNAHGSGWKCDRGYRKVGEACVAVDVPANAHLDYSGNQWDCNRPYRKQHDECALPQAAFSRP